MTPPASHYEIAVEQWLYWHRQGLSNLDMLNAVRQSHEALDNETTIRILAHVHCLLIDGRLPT